MFGFGFKKTTAAEAYQKGDFALAHKLALKTLRKNPQDINSLLIVGNTFYIEGDYARANEYYQKILRQDSKNFEALVNSGEAFLRQKKYAAAKDVSLALKDSPEGIFLKAKIDFEEERFQEAQDGFLYTLKQQPNNFWAWNLLSQAAQKNGDFDLALESAWQAVCQSGGEDSQHLNMAYTLYEIAAEIGKEKVLPYVKKWHKKYAENSIVQQSWNAFFPSENFAKSDINYVQNVFDNFADSFDEVLSSLNYQVPQIIAREIKKYGSEMLPKNPHILDAGCGTGLCAKYLDSALKKYKLYGVDISAQMLAKARQRGKYKELKKEDIESYLAKGKNKFDLIIAADVFTYFGTLEKVFSACANSLSDEGMMIFSITKNEDDTEAWKQHLSGRFVHGKKYVQKALKQGGFQRVIFTSCILRKEGEKEVSGWIISTFKTKKKFRK